MNIEHYQDLACTFANYNNNTYPIFALAEECGELSKIYAKAARGDTRYITDTEEFTDEAKELLAGEIGDILWMLAAIARDNYMSLGDIATMNIEKLTNRKVKGIIRGDGDKR